MKHSALKDRFHTWLLGTADDPDFSGRHHCFTVRRDVVLAPGETVDFISIRHERPTHPEGRASYSVGLWQVVLGPVDRDAIDQACRRLQGFRAWYGDVLNQVELKGLPRTTPAGFHANLVGDSIIESPLVRMLSTGFGDLALWTWRRLPDGIDVEPHYADSSPATRVRLFRRLFQHCSSKRSAARSLSVV